MNGSFLRLIVALPLFGGLIAGCTGGYTSVLPNDLEGLNRKPAEFAAAAARRTYPENVPVIPAQQIAAEAQYTFDHLDLVNFTGEPLTDVEVWVNQEYVVFLPTLPNQQIAKVPFRTLYNRDGLHFPTNNKAVTIREVHLLSEGELLDVPVDIAD